MMHIKNPCRSKGMGGYCLNRRRLLVLLLVFLSVKSYAFQAVVPEGITLRLNQVTIEQVFNEIRQQTGYKILYNSKAVKSIPRFDISVSKATVAEVLDRCLKSTGFTYEIEDKTILISKKSPEKIQVMGSIVRPGEAHGSITDQKGIRLPSITVMSKTNHRVTVSNEQGEFHLPDVSNADTLMFSSLNYETVSVVANTMGEMIIMMRPQITSLSAVTVYNTGYQQLSRERATGAFGKPDMETFQNRVATNDIIDRLDGQVAGVTVVHNYVAVSGQQSKTNSSLIRGTSSVALSTEPLYVVNGVVVTDFTTVNPQDIDDITVLKDAAAAAIYGARAANGIIVVHTKEARKGSKLQVSYNGSLNFQGKPDVGYQPWMNSRQLIEVVKETFNPDLFPYSALTYATIPPHEKILYDIYQGAVSPAQGSKSLDSLAGIDNRSQIKDLFYTNALLTNHTVSVSAGNNIYGVYASLGYTGSQASIAGNYSNSYKLNLTQTINANNCVRLVLNTSLVNTVVKGNGNKGVDPGFLPYQLFKDPSGNNMDIPYLAGYSDSMRHDYETRSGINLNYNPLNEINYGHSKENDLSVNVTAEATVKLWKGLSFRGNYGYVKSPGTSETYTDHQSLEQRFNLLNFTVVPVDGVPQYYLPLTGGHYIKTNTEQRNWTVRNQFVYTAAPRQSRDLFSLQVGQEAQEAYDYSDNAELYGYDEARGTYPLIDYLSLTNGINGILGYGALSGGPYKITRKNISRYSSYFALGTYTYNHKYSLDISWRTDHSNLFGSDVSAQNKPAWSVGGKWQIIQEPFMQAVNWVNDLGLRATYGITGNSPYVGQASSNDILLIVSQGYGSIAGDYLSVNSPANRGLVWETTKTMNLGIDFSLFKRRVSGAVNAYSKSTTNMIGSVPLNPFTGFQTITGNQGKMINKGIELTLNTNNIQGQTFSWSTSFIFSYNKNELVSYGPSYNVAAQAYYYLLSGLPVAGYAMSPLFAYRFAGLDDLGDPQIKLSDKSVSKDPNLAIKGEDLVYKGTMVPVFNGGLTNTFRYKGISLAVNMIYNLGHVMRRDINTYYTDMVPTSPQLGLDNITTYFFDRWKQPGDEKKTNVPSYVADYYTSSSRRNINYYRSGDINVVSASYIKVRDLTLSYGLSPTILQALKVQRINVYVQATNFMVWKANHDHIDPEFQDFGNGIRGLPPYKHSYSIGLNVTL
ncbi:SusC/RagA family TonB-linked outer membrane protein [Chitinophaga sp. 30R24]|uniref:SusC/RagA family TonB-linked outer membrane protein n=1 Tax=Chitinophaga sp. 30R24 TaxID=3248838 RepID=UPI003B90D00F